MSQLQPSLSLLVAKRTRSWRQNYRALNVKTNRTTVCSRVKSPSEISHHIQPNIQAWHWRSFNNSKQLLHLKHNRLNTRGHDCPVVSGSMTNRRRVFLCSVSIICPRRFGCRFIKVGALSADVGWSRGVCSEDDIPVEDWINSKYSRPGLDN